jgi:hypothetical protein
MPAISTNSIPGEKKPRKIIPFPLGNIYITRGAQEKLNNQEVTQALIRHVCGDWGNLCLEDWELNNEAVVRGFRILSSYVAQNGQKFWIITEADRTATTILLPEEY